jgi:hypothetical protein
MQSLRRVEQRFLQTLLDDGARLAGVSPAESIDVYRNNFLEGHRKALAATYPVVAALVGADCFRTLAYDYARGYPSRAGDLAQFGGEFPFFLRALYASGEHAYLVDVARLEWSYIDALNAADATALAAQSLAATVDAERLTFEFQPSVRLLRSPFPVLAIWQAHQHDGDFRIDLAAGEDRLLIHRPLFDVEIVPLDVAQYGFVQELYHGQPLAHALDSALSHDPDFDLAACLTLLLERRVLTDCALAARFETSDSSGDLS